ncbi:hypothetical protein FRB96_001683 [Tulasnella sp. 330]|nr:hypothetical protein FRB96_001683 [Tulasnella sp. 330]
MSNFLFAFGPEGTDSYYVSNRVFHCWKNLSPKLEDRLKQPSFAADKVESLSIFPNGGFFIVGDNDAYAYYRVPFALQTIINSLSGGVSSVAGIEFDAANAESYVICVRPTRRLHHNALPQQLLNDVLALAFVGLQEICIGYGGTYNLITNHSVSVGRLAGRHSLQVVTLSPYNPRHYFAVFKDGSLEYDLPILWRPVIEKLSSMTNDPSTPKTPRSHNAPLSPPIFSNPAYEPMATQNPTPPYTPEAPSSYAQQQTMYEINQSAPYLTGRLSVSIWTIQGVTKRKETVTPRRSGKRSWKALWSEKEGLGQPAALNMVGSGVAKSLPE